MTPNALWRRIILRIFHLYPLTCPLAVANVIYVYPVSCLSTFCGWALAEKFSWDGLLTRIRISSVNASFYLDSSVEDIGSS